MSGRLGLRLADTHSDVADGQVTQPLLLQTSIEPSLLTAQPQRAPVAVLSMHAPTASRPFTAKLAVDSIVSASASMHLRARDEVIEVNVNIVISL